MTVLPAIVAVPLRTGPVFGWMSSRTVPLPAAVLTAPIAIQSGLLLFAGHEQSGDVVTFTICDPPPAGSAIVSGATAGLQPPS